MVTPGMATSGGGQLYFSDMLVQKIPENLYFRPFPTEKRANSSASRNVDSNHLWKVMSSPMVNYSVGILVCPSTFCECSSVSHVPWTDSVCLWTGYAEDGVTGECTK